MENVCNICPRKCNVNRETTLGFCRMPNDILIAKVMIHHFEEPIISGECDDTRGSGAIFFAGCSLGCIYCQNSNISGGGAKSFVTNGFKKVTPKELADIFKKLEDKGAYNINLVTPTHYTMQIIQALKIYKPKVPVVWNTSGYELPETIKLLDGLVDIYLTDFKYFEPANAKRFSFAENYPKICKTSLLEMKKQQPKDVIENGLMKKGIIVRHLVLPKLLNDSLKVIDFVHDNLGEDTIFSLMSQYVPMVKAQDDPQLCRRITPLEYKILCRKLEKLEFKNAFVQEFESAKSSFTPDFEINDEFFV